MVRRRQVLLDEAELREVQRAARSRRMIVAEWVRQALRAERRRQPAGDPSRTLAAVRAAARHAFPTGDIEQMLAEIARGCDTGPHP